MVNSLVSDGDPKKDGSITRCVDAKWTWARMWLERMKVFSFSRPRKQNENIGHEIRFARVSFRACDSPLSPAESEIRDGQTGIKKKHT